MPDRLVEVGDGDAVVATRVGGVVDEHVDAPERGHDAIDEILDRLGAAHVADPRHRAPAALTHLLRGALDVLPAGLLLVVRIRRRIAAGSRDDDIGALARERDCGRAADPAQPSGARDDRKLAVEKSHFALSSSVVAAELRYWVCRRGATPVGSRERGGGWWGASRDRRPYCA